MKTSLLGALSILLISLPSMAGTYHLTGDFQLPSPPAVGSPQAATDLDEVLALQKARTSQDCDRAATEAVASLKSMFGPPYGPLSVAEVDRLTAFFDDVGAATSEVSRKIKVQWNRPRPFVVDSHVEPCIPQEKTGSYPSGHATLSRVVADLLAEIYPARAAEFSARADQVAQDRVLGGLHFPSDIHAGKQLGDEIYDALKGDHEFQSRLAALVLK